MPMGFFSAFFFPQGTLLKKLLMATTGSFLVLFLVGHLMGNLQLLVDNHNEAARLQFNGYAHFMTTHPVVRVLSIVTYLSVLLHVVYALVLALHNKRARPWPYKKRTPAAGVGLASRNMGVLGTLVLIFLVIHLRGFWYEMHWGAIGTDAHGNRDIYEVVASAYAQGWYVAVYVVSMVFLGYHLCHGFVSAFRTFGLQHEKTMGAVQLMGLVFSILVPALFAMIPIVMYLRS